jgi:gluconolactonase
MLASHNAATGWLCLALMLSVLGAPGGARAGSPTLHSKGWVFTEGPLWLDDGTLLWVDAWASRILRQAPDGPIEELAVATRRPAGLALGADGRLLVTEFGGDQVSAVDLQTLELEVLADSFGDRPLNSPNDLIVDAQGGIWFTDPAFFEAASQRDQQVLYISPDGDVQRVAGGLRTPNGLAFSPDGRYLVVAEFFAGRLTRFEITGPGEVGEGQVIARVPTPDGMCVDDDGMLYVAAGGNIVVLDFDGNVAGTLRIPADSTNCAILGDTMVVTAKSKVFEVALPPVLLEWR